MKLKYKKRIDSKIFLYFNAGKKKSCECHTRLIYFDYTVPPSTYGFPPHVEINQLNFKTFKYQQECFSMKSSNDIVYFKTSFLHSLFKNLRKYTWL